MFRYLKATLQLSILLASSNLLGQDYSTPSFIEDSCSNQRCSSCSNFSFRGEVLVWKTYEENSDWGTRHKFFTANDLDFANQDKQLDFDFGFDTGFRLGTNYQFPCTN